MFRVVFIALTLSIFVVADRVQARCHPCRRFFPPSRSEPAPQQRSAPPQPAPAPAPAFTVTAPPPAPPRTGARAVSGAAPQPATPTRTESRPAPPPPSTSQPAQAAQSNPDSSAPAAAAPAAPVVPVLISKPLNTIDSVIQCKTFTDGWVSCQNKNTGATILPDCNIIQCGAGIGCIPPGRCYDCDYLKTCGNLPVKVNQAQAAAGQIINFYCDPNNWSGGGCSVSCGGGTQTNACGGTRSCNTQACIRSWWQVKDGSAVAGGNVRSSVPAGQTLVTGTPGVVACGGAFCPTDAQVGPGNWSVSSSVSRAIADRNSYARFKAQVGNKFTAQDFPTPLADSLVISGRPATDGVIYWLAAGPTRLPGQDLGTNRVVLLADGNVDITGNLTFAEGGFLAILSGGDIKVAGSVTRLQGLYLAQGIFDTGDSALPLQIDGSVAGLTKVKLSRTYASGTTPAELFIYHPEYLTNLPTGLMRRKQFKQELVP